MNSDILEKKHRYNMLYGYYGTLLTKRQQVIFESYFYDDFSLGEIANEEGISRTAIHDALKTVQHNLDQFEEKLQLYQKDSKLAELLAYYEPLLDDMGQKLIKSIREME